MILTIGSNQNNSISWKAVDGEQVQLYMFQLLKGLKKDNHK